MMKISVLVMFLFVSACTGDLNDHIVGKFYYRLESNQDRIIKRQPMILGEPYIPCTVLDYVKDKKNYILAVQRAREKCFFEGQNPLQQEEDELYYWIIDVENEIFLGPYDYDVFLNKSNKLGLTSICRSDKCWSNWVSKILANLR